MCSLRQRARRGRRCPRWCRRRTPPVSATAKLTPVMPASAARKFSRRCCRRRLGQVRADRSRLRSVPIVSWNSWRHFFLASCGWPAARCGSGGSSAELHDPLAQVGVDHLDAVLLEVRIEVALLGEHRLALDQPAGRRARCRMSSTICVVLGRVAGPVDHARRGASRCARTARGSRPGAASVWALIAEASSRSCSHSGSDRAAAVALLAQRTRASGRASAARSLSAMNSARPRRGRRALHTRAPAQDLGDVHDTRSVARRRARDEPLQVHQARHVGRMHLGARLSWS